MAEIQCINLPGAPVVWVIQTYYGKKPVAVTLDWILDYSITVYRALWTCFVKKTSDMLLKLPMVLSSGMPGSEPWQNAGEVTNSGYELTLGWKKRIGKFEYGH